MRVCSIASGSSGNCIYVGTDTTHVLVDVGISRRRTEEGLKKLGIKPETLDAILVTHEHADHINGLGVMTRKYASPIYLTAGTAHAVRSVSSLGVMDESLFRQVRQDESFWIKDLKVTPMWISHDAAEPVAYRFTHGHKRLAVVTDLGTYNDYTLACLQGMNALVLEANHDVDMLMTGSYPYPLKQRILGNRGHLSNENAGKLLRGLLHQDLKAVVLAHLSQENNLPELACETVRREIADASVYSRPEELWIQVANRYTVSTPVEL